MNFKKNSFIIGDASHSKAFVAQRQSSRFLI
jgi:hypothetical protein